MKRDKIGGYNSESNKTAPGTSVLEAIPKRGPAGMLLMAA